MSDGDKHEDALALEAVKHENALALEVHKHRLAVDLEWENYKATTQVERYRERMLREREQWVIAYRAGKAAVAALAVLALRSLILANGAAVIAILTFLGHMAREGSPSQLAKVMVPALHWFLGGVTLGMVAAALAYLSQVFFTELPATHEAVTEEAEAKTKAKDHPAGTWTRIGAVLLAFGSLASFVVGSYAAMGGLTGLPEPAPKIQSIP